MTTDGGEGGGGGGLKSINDHLHNYFQTSLAGGYEGHWATVGGRQTKSDNYGRGGRGEGVGVLVNIAGVVTLYPTQPRTFTPFFLTRRSGWARETRN